METVGERIIREKENNCAMNNETMLEISSFVYDHEKYFRMRLITGNTVVRDCRNERSTYRGRFFFKGNSPLSESTLYRQRVERCLFPGVEPLH